MLDLGRAELAQHGGCGLCADTSTLSASLESPAHFKVTFLRCVGEKSDGSDEDPTQKLGLRFFEYPPKSPSLVFVREIANA